MLERAGPRIRAMLETMTVQQASPKLLRLGVPAHQSAMARDHLPDIVRLVQETGARSMSIQFVDIKPGGPKASSAAKGGAGSGGNGPDGDGGNREQTDDRGQSAGAQTEGENAPPAHDPREADNHPLVRRAAEVFGAKVTHIHPKRR